MKRREFLKVVATAPVIPFVPVAAAVPASVVNYGRGPEVEDWQAELIEVLARNMRESRYFVASDVIRRAGAA